MITGYNGIARKISDRGYDDDEVIEFLMTLSAINGIRTTSDDDTVTFSIALNDNTCPLFTLSPPWYSLVMSINDLTLFFEENGVPPFYANTIYKDLSCIIHGLRIPFDTALLNRDNIILAVYRLMHLIKYND